VRKLTLIGLGLTLFVSLSCSKIVGITDTDVTSGIGGSAESGSGGSDNPGGSGKTGVAGSQGNDGGSNNAGAGGSAGTDTTSHAGAGMSTGGTATGGTATGGTATGGTATGGTATGGTATGGTSTGGSQAGGGGKGGSGGSGGKGGSGGNGGSGGAPVLHGPKLIDVGAFSVDATEVTVAQYKEFLTAKAGNTSGQIPACSWNTSFYAAGAMPTENNAWPVANVDWCDANAFCAWAGKRLCGAITGGPVDFANFEEATKSQWYRACGGPNGGTHPNASPACNNDFGFTDLAPVASFAGCEGYPAGVFDMQGNAAEWVDSCDGSTGKADHCILAGGSELDQNSFCTETFQDQSRDVTSHYFGFRCCSK